VAGVVGGGVLGCVLWGFVFVRGIRTYGVTYESHDSESFAFRYDRQNASPLLHGIISMKRNIITMKVGASINNLVG